MAGLAETDTVDLVAQDAAGQVLVVMVETRRWGVDRAQSAQLRAKINAYAGFITDGSLVRRYPQAAGHKVLIQLDRPSRLLANSQRSSFTPRRSFRKSWLASVSTSGRNHRQPLP